MKIQTDIARLIACDIDGTLLNTGEPVTPTVRAAVADVLAAGHHVVLATGRSLVGALPVAAELGLDDAWIVASNGAVTAHAQGGDFEITDLHVVDPEPVVRVVVEAMPGIRVATEVVGVGYLVNIPFPDGELNGMQRSVGPLGELWADPTPRLAIHGPAAYGLVPVLRAMSLTAIATRYDWIDVTPPALSKATALDKVRRRLGVEFHATAAIGDGENDLRCCGGPVWRSPWGMPRATCWVSRTGPPAPSTRTAQLLRCCHCWADVRLRFVELRFV